MKKPICPNHPESAVINVRAPATTKREWACIVCAKRLGEAPSRESKPELVVPSHNEEL